MLHQHFVFVYSRNILSFLKQNYKAKLLLVHFRGFVKIQSFSYGLHEIKHNIRFKLFGSYKSEQPPSWKHSENIRKRSDCNATKRMFLVSTLQTYTTMYAVILILTSFDCQCTQETPGVENSSNIEIFIISYR